jgi:hypothetical protein
VSFFAEDLDGLGGGKPADPVPVSAAMALVRAGAAGRTLTSPTPVGGSPHSISGTSIRGTDCIPHDPVAVEVLGDDLAAVAKHDLAPGGAAQRVDEAAFDLGADHVRG